MKEEREWRGEERERDMESSSREARRKKIMEGGSNRMALITGGIGSLSSSSMNPPSSTEASSSPPLLFSDDSQVPQPNLSDQIHVRPNDVASGNSTLPKNVSSNEFLKGNNVFDIGSQVEPQVLKGETSAEAKQALAKEVTFKLQPSPATSIVQKSSTGTEKPLKSDGRSHRNSLTPRQISSCIMASEATRIICSLIIALLVVLSYVDHPLLGINLVRSESVVASRPLYILLLTDITIVLARLFLESRRILEKVEEERVAPHDEDGHSWAGAVKVLETGLVVYQSICAVFMDFCLYAVVVICGLSFV